MAIDLESLGLTEMIRLRERLADALIRRYERTLAIALTVIEDGDDAARLVDILSVVAPGGTPVVIAGGVLSSFPSADAAATALVELERRALDGGPPPRSAIHWGPVLTNGRLYSGDALKVCALVAASGAPGEVRITRQAYVELSSRFRLRCQPLPPLAAEGGRQVELTLLRWRESVNRPAAVRIEETNQRFLLPDQPVITFGRLPGNDVVLSLPDAASHQRIRRQGHVELRRELDELYLYPQADRSAEVDGQHVASGERARVVPGTVVRLAGVVTLTFQGDPAGVRADDEAQQQTIAVPRGAIKDR